MQERDREIESPIEVPPGQIERQIDQVQLGPLTDSDGASPIDDSSDRGTHRGIVVSSTTQYLDCSRNPRCRTTHGRDPVERAGSIVCRELHSLCDRQWVPNPLIIRNTAPAPIDQRSDERLIMIDGRGRQRHTRQCVRNKKGLRGTTLRKAGLQPFEGVEVIDGHMRNDCTYKFGPSARIASIHSVDDLEGIVQAGRREHSHQIDQGAMGMDACAERDIEGTSTIDPRQPNGQAHLRFFGMADVSVSQDAIENIDSTTRIYCRDSGCQGADSARRVLEISLAVDELLDEVREQLTGNRP